MTACDESDVHDDVEVRIYGYLHQVALAVSSGRLVDIGATAHQAANEIMHMTRGRDDD